MNRQDAKNAKTKPSSKDLAALSSLAFLAALAVKISATSSYPSRAIRCGLDKPFS
jgi:hypothetical protein